MDKEIINNNNIESQILKEKDEQINDKNEPENLEIKGDLTSKKIILKKNVRQLNAPNQDNNDNIPNEEIPNVEIEIKNDSEENNYNELLINNDDEEIKIENPSNNIEEKNNELEKNENKENKEKGYLDDDLEDEDNKKLYLRVVKRMEQTYGVPIIAAIIPGDKIENIEIEENIRTILINNKNIEQKKLINNQQNLHYKNNNIENINNNIQNIQVIQNKSYNKNPYNNKNNIITYEYNINNNTKEIKQYINNPINFNRPPIYQNKNSNNFINNSQKYTNNYPINTRTPNYIYNFQSSQKYNKDRIRTNNMYLSRYITKKENKTPIVNNRKNIYSYESPIINMQIKKKEMPNQNHKIYNSRYQGYLNNSIGKKENKNNYIPLSNINYYNTGKTKNLFGDIPKVNPERFNNYNIMRKTYNVLSNQNKISDGLIGNQKNNINYNGNKYNYTIQSLSLMPKRSPIFPKSPNIPINYNNNNLKNDHISYTTSFITNKQNIKSNNLTKKPSFNLSMNKSQNILNIKNYNIGFNGNNNYERNNVRNYSYNPLTRSLNVNNNNSRKILNNSNINSLQNYQINYNCSNFNNSYGVEIPQARTYVTYCIDSTYY